MTIFQMLKSDHKKVMDFFKQIQKCIKDGETEEARELFEKARSELTIHAQAEERVVYSRLREHDPVKYFSYEGEEAHTVVVDILSKMEAEENEDRFNALFSLLKKLVSQHVKEEEELFPKLRKIFSKEEEITMREEMESAKKYFSGSDEEKGEEPRERRKRSSKDDDVIRVAHES